MKRIIPVLLFIFLLSIAAMGQDIHFSEFYNNPLQLNPSYTGFFNGDYRLSSIYRNQWSAITVPYTTVEGTADFRFVTSNTTKDIFGLGINAFSDKAGDSQFSTNEITLSAAFSLAYGPDQNNYISAGISAGIGDASIDYSNLVFDQQWFEPNTPTTENVSMNNYDYADLSSGISWHYIPNKFTNFNIGASMFHINQPVQSFLGESASQLFRKYVVDASAQFSVGNNLDLYPKGMYELQGPYQELDLGALLRFNLSPDYIHNQGFYVGAFYRFGDAIIITTRVDLNKVSIALSYDITTSTLFQDSRAQGGPELSLIYIGKLEGTKRSTYCPRF